MSTVRRSESIQASPETIWDYLADPAHWPQWDPDITSVGTSQVGIVDGRTWPLRVRPGIGARMVFDDVQLHRSFEWDIRALGGLIESEAEFRLEPGTEPGMTVLHYEFELEGPAGQLLDRLRSSAVESAVEAGLANIRRAVEQR